MNDVDLRDIFRNVEVSPYEELMAYEYLYSRNRASLNSVSKQTVLNNLLPHEALIAQYGLFAPDGIEDIASLIDSKLGGFSVAINGTSSWPKKLIDSEKPTPLLYYRGNIGLLDSRSVSVVGARKASKDGLHRAAIASKKLVEMGITVVTGLAAGIDTSAAQAAIENGGNTVGVIGTPIDEYYPKENKDLQDIIAKNYLLVSQVPFYKYSIQPFKTKKYYFPERNELMAAISDATIIVEASDTSGTLIQAKACLHQGRPLFIMRSCADNSNIRWPSRFLEKEGVYILDDIRQVSDVLAWA